jgi:hypothetical protein
LPKFRMIVVPSSRSNSLYFCTACSFKMKAPRSSETLRMTQNFSVKVKVRSRPQQAARAQGFPGRLRPRIILTFGTTRVVGRQPHAPAAFTPRTNPWYSFLEAESTPGHMAPSVAMEKIPSVTPPGIDPETVRLVAQCLNYHCATPEPSKKATVK